MDELISALRRLSQTKRLVPAEEVIMTELEKLDKHLVPGIAETTLTELEQILFGFLTVNNSKISIQCSLYIGDKLLQVYKLMKSPQLFDLITLAITKGTASTIIGAGKVCLRIGDKSKSQLPRFVEFLLSQKSHTFAVVFALRACFKAGGKSLSAFLIPSFEYVKKLLLHSTQASLVMELKFLKSIIWIPKAPIDQILEAAKMVYTAQKTPVVRNDIAIIVARCAFAPIYSKLEKNLKDQSDWAITRNDNENNELDLSFQILTIFGKMLKETLLHFINSLPTAVIARNAIPLFRFVRANCPQLVSQLAPLLPSDPKYALFEEICKEQVSPAQLRLIIDLLPDKHAIVDAASVALKLAVSTSPDAKKAADDFFAMAAKSYPAISLQYLKTSIEYLTHLPDAEEALTAEIRGYGSVAYTILTNFPRIEDAVVPNKDLFKEFIDEVFSKVTYSWRVAEAFNILSVLPAEYVTENKISDGVVMVATYLVNQTQSALWHKMLKMVLRFRSRHPDAAQNNLLIVAAMSCTEELPISVLTSLEIITTEPSLAFDICKRIIAVCPKLKINQELLRLYIKKLLPSGNDLLLRFAGPKDADMHLDALIRTFPSLFLKCETSAKTAVFQALARLDSAVGYLFILAISQQAPSKLPKRLNEVLMPKLALTNMNVIQIIAEIMANFVAQYPHMIGQVFDFMEAHKEFVGCPFVLNSLFQRISVDGKYISRSLAFIERNMKSSGTIPFALYAMSSMLVTHSMEFTDLGINLGQVTVLFQTIHTNLALQPIVLHLITECFASLIEINSQTLATKGNTHLMNLVSLLIKTIKLTPIAYSKVAYFNIARSLILFVHSIVPKIISLEFPQGRDCSTTLLLNACETFSDYMRFGYVKVSARDMIKPLLLILQKTDDCRAAYFIEGLVNSGSERMWVSTIRRILLANSLLDDSLSAIEPNISVKIAVLHIAVPVLEYMGAQEEFNSEHLDDLVASVCRAISSGEIEIQEAAFPVLEKVMSLFKDRKAEDGGRLLELYDVQFTTAVKVGFELNLSISGDFLSAYLVFATQGIFNNMVINGYIAGLKDCQQRNTAYYSLLTRLCCSCRGNMDDEIKQFLIDQLPNMTAALTDTMKLQKDDWRQRALLRTLYSKCYAEMIPASIWLMTLLDELPMDPNVLLSFFLLETWTEKEPWKLAGAINSIPLIFEYMGGSIKPELIELVIRTSVKWHNDPNFTSILKGCSRSGTLSYTSREYLLTLALESKFEEKTFGYLLHNDKNKDLSKFAFSIAKHFVEHNASLPLFVILFEHTKNVIGYTLELILKSGKSFGGAKLEIVRIGLMRSSQDDWLPIRDIAKFLLQNLTQGGLQVISSIMLQRQEIGLAIMKEHVAKAIVLLASNDIGNSSTFVQFLEVAMNTSKGTNIEKPFAQSLVKLMCSIMCKFGMDPQKGPKIMTACVQVVIQLREILGGSMESIFEGINEAERTEVCKVLTTQINKAGLRKNNANLKSFAMGLRTRKAQDEWQTLEIGDSD